MESEFWRALGIALGSNAALLGGLWFLLRAFSSHVLAKDLERFKAELSSAATAEAERLKHDLQLGALEHQVRFSKLHERRAEVIAELYALLNEVHTTSQWFVTTAKPEDYPPSVQSINEFYRYFNAKKIYLPAPLCPKFEELIKKMHIYTGEFSAYVKVADEHHPNVLRDKLPAWIKAGRHFDQDIPPAREALEAELRALLDPALNRAREAGTGAKN